MPSDTALPPPNSFIAPEQTFNTVDDQAANIAFAHPGWKLWWLAFGGAVGLVGVLLVLMFFIFWLGVGIWGNNIPVTWALDITSYDFWIGAGCGGVALAGLLILLDIEWRTTINRVAETIGLFATCAAAVYPIIHLGRPWFFYWTLPRPNTMELWPQFRSPVDWDAFDLISLLLIAILFWYIGLLPDLGTLRDRAFERIPTVTERQRFMARVKAQLYGIVALGWRGSALHWHRWTQAYRSVALFGVLQVVCLQTGASLEYAAVPEPGWHDTLLPFHFVFLALYLGTAVIVALAMMLRAVFAMQSLLTTRHMDMLGKLLLFLAWVNIYCYAYEFFNTYLGGDSYEIQLAARRATGWHSWSLWLLVSCALLSVQLLWIPALRRSPSVLGILGILIAAGLWGDHYMTIVTTLQHDFLPSSARPYHIDLYGMLTFVGSAGLFTALLLLCLRYMPVFGIMETRRIARLAPEDNAPQASTQYELARRHQAAGSTEHSRGKAPTKAEEEGAPLYGVAAEFTTPEALLASVRRMHRRRLGRIDTCTPIPVPEIVKALRVSPRSVWIFAFAGLVLGAATMMMMCIWATAYGYVFNIAGRPRFSWPYFIVPSFAIAMLSGSCVATLAMLMLNRFPHLNHPVFNIPGYGRSSRNRFFIVVEAHDEHFDADTVETELAMLPQPPLAIHRVPR